ncbi:MULTISPECIES: hypothetical protein [unclassified Mesorhizobium]|uniref:hypothetical protein n=1 Tax=unclassified Mesorhizobium TaxID=325217 RepID=UPI000BAFECD1|nr:MULTISPECIES: hypothetical protein [unclassified Mesorhizobium]PBB22842.1 hypothetical protein CK232_31385 [Mesorhizobium sp. WSM4304]PBB71736.1 hypothetical protein CK227_30745 [Mesorhizobium sp. WSM4308]
MGGGSGGSYTPINIDAITAAANERIQNAFKEERSILFVCNSDDRDELLGRIQKSDALKKRPFDISTEGDAELEKKVGGSSLVILFSNKSDEHSHVNKAIVAAAAQKKQSIYVKGDSVETIPQYVAQFRVRTVSWSALLEILA